MYFYTLVMSDQSQNQGTPGTSTSFTTWPQPMNWSYSGLVF